jgi:hypothetical protein
MWPKAERQIALNRELWAIVNERFTNGAAESMWGMPEVGRATSVRWGALQVSAFANAELPAAQPKGIHAF